MNKIWRLLVLDKSGTYTQIYDEIYGKDPKELAALLALYSKDENLICIILES